MSRHQHFIYRSIIDINKKLLKYRRKVYIFQLTHDRFFNFITEKYNIKNVFSYQESGTKNSWIRDISVEKIFKSKNIVWKQFENQGVVHL